jgi:hypothetical protein
VIHGDDAGLYENGMTTEVELSVFEKRGRSLCSARCVMSEPCNAASVPVAIFVANTLCKLLAQKGCYYLLELMCWGSHWILDSKCGSVPDIGLVEDP